MDSGHKDWLCVNGFYNYDRTELVKELKRLQTDKKIINAVRCTFDTYKVAKILIDANLFEVFIRTFGFLESDMLFMLYLKERYEVVMKKSNKTGSKILKDFIRDLNLKSKSYPNGMLPDDSIDGYLPIISRCFREHADTTHKELNDVYEANIELCSMFTEAYERVLEQMETELKDNQNDINTMNSIIAELTALSEEST